MNIRERCIKINLILKDAFKTSVRSISKITGISKSSVHRYKKKIENRNCFPESYFWETAEGQKWLTIFVYATIYTFSITCGIGAEKLFFFQNSSFGYACWNISNDDKNFTIKNGRYYS